MKTLVVEDDFSSRALMQAIMSPYGQCQVAANGKEAIQLFDLAWEEEQPFDLILMDIMMPEMDGQTALKEIRRKEAEMDVHGLKGVKIIMTTVLHDKENVMEAFKSQCEGYIVKPVDKRKLLAQIKLLGLPIDDSSIN